MHSHSPLDTRSPRRSRSRGRKAALWVGLAVGGVLPATGCQVEYAGMTLPSGKYLGDDVQYFPPGPDFPWANTQAATQRARMQAMGLDVPAATPTGPVTLPPPAQGALPPGNVNQAGGVPNINNQINQPGGGNAPAPGGAPPAAQPVPNQGNPGAPPAGNGAAPGGDAPAGGDMPANPGR